MGGIVPAACDLPATSSSQTYPDLSSRRQPHGPNPESFRTFKNISAARSGRQPWANYA
jgi:hypothetical protein